MSRILRCAACTRRIRSHHAYVGLIDYESRAEIAYHARCQQRGVEDFASLVEGGKLYVLRHYHVCGDEVNGFGCSGGCFSESPEVGAN